MTVRAAGGVVWRRGPDGGVEVLVIHRERYDDWTFPKGKNEAGEADDACARREVEEETGVVARLGRELAQTRYVDHLGRPKVVRWWAMTVDAQRPWVPDHEVDAQAWVSLAEARRRLTYARDVEVLDDFERTLAE